MLRQGASLSEIGELLGHHNHTPPRLPRFTPKWTWMPCGPSPCPGREVCDEHPPGSSSGLLKHATQLGV
jgi:hypothetical protein